MTNLQKFHERFFRSGNYNIVTFGFKFMKISDHGNPEVVMITTPLRKERRQAAYCFLLEVIRKELGKTSFSRHSLLL